MNFFEQELRRIADVCDGINNPTFAGRACFADLGGDNRVKIQFVTLGVHENYEALKATVLNRLDGEVDSLLFRFRDTWGKKPVPNNQSFRDGVIPHIWTYNGKTEWYAYRPTDMDIKTLATEASAYLAVFTDHSLVMDKAREQDSVIKTIRESKKNPAPRKDTQARNKSEPDFIEEVQSI